MVNLLLPWLAGHNTTLGFSCLFVFQQGYVLSIFIRSEHNIGYTSVVIHGRQLNQIGLGFVQQENQSIQ